MRKRSSGESNISFPTKASGDGFLPSYSTINGLDADSLCVITPFSSLLWRLSFKKGIANDEKIVLKEEGAEKDGNNSISSW